MALGTSESYTSRVFIPLKLTRIRSNYNKGYDPVKNSRKPLTCMTNWLFLSLTRKRIYVSSTTFLKIIFKTSSALVTSATSTSTLLYDSGNYSKYFSRLTTIRKE